MLWCAKWLAHSSFIVLLHLTNTMFLWRTNATISISDHDRRFDVFMEAKTKKAAAKYDTSTDFQVEVQNNAGLTHYSEAKLLDTSGSSRRCSSVVILSSLSLEAPSKRGSWTMRS